MMWSTHWLLGINSLWLMVPLLQATSHEDVGWLIITTSLGSLLPDLDATNSKIKHLQIAGIKPFFVPAQIVHSTDVHRGMLHSLVGVGFVAMVSVPLAISVGWAAWLALLLGYASHLLADAATKTGIRLLYPRQQRYYLLPKRWRITTGSQAEEMLLPFLTTSLLLLLRHIPSG